MLLLKNCELELSYILAELFNKCLKESCFPDSWKFSLAIPVSMIVGERSTTKNYHPVSLFSVVSNAFEKLIIELLITWRNVNFLLISSIVLGLLNQLQILLQLYLIELLELLTGLGLLELWHFISPRYLTGFGMLVFFLWNFRSNILPFFLFFSEK